MHNRALHLGCAMPRYSVLSCLCMFFSSLDFSCCRLIYLTTSCIKEKQMNGKPLCNLRSPQNRNPFHRTEFKKENQATITALRHHPTAHSTAQPLHSAAPRQTTLVVGKSYQQQGKRGRRRVCCAPLTRSRQRLLPSEEE